MEQHVKYLLSQITKKQSHSEIPHLEEMYKQLNKVMGVYWIVCGLRLLRYEISAEMKVRIFDIISSKDHIIDPAMHNGLLRGLSVVQTSTLIGMGEELRDRIGAQTVNFLNRNFESLPFWFDMRSIYCMVSILTLTNRISEISPEARNKTVDFIHSSQAILGGFGARPRSEAHGGYTFCAVASLSILGEPVRLKDRLVKWISTRLSQMNGRPGKPRDSCYVWWGLGSLKNLKEDISDKRDLIDEILSDFQVTEGGFSKLKNSNEPDLFHTFLAIASISLLDNEGCIDASTVLPSF
jgi:hypothetical protein